MITYVVLAILAAAVLGIAVRRFVKSFVTFRGVRVLACPENRQPAAVALDGWRAAVTGAFGSPALRVRECSRWRNEARCARVCIADIQNATPGAPGFVSPPRAFTHPQCRASERARYSRAPSIQSYRGRLAVFRTRQHTHSSKGHEGFDESANGDSQDGRGENRKDNVGDHRSPPWRLIAHPKRTPNRRRFQTAGRADCEQPDAQCAQAVFLLFMPGCGAASKPAPARRR